MRGGNVNVRDKERRECERRRGACEVIGEMEESPCEDRRGLEKTVDTQFQ